MGTWSDLAPPSEGRTPPVSVAVSGAGFMGRGLLHRLHRSPGMRPTLLVNRDRGHAEEALRFAGIDARNVVASDDPDTLASAIADGLVGQSSDPGALSETGNVDLVVEATGAMAYGAQTVLACLEAGRPVVSYNAELDATIGHLLHDVATRHDTVYTIADGDQPGVLLRQLAHVTEMGFEVVAALNCKRNLDVHQTPTDSQPFADRDGTSVLMTTAFGDGTKMQIENAVVANLADLPPDKRGMHGVETTLAEAVSDVVARLGRTGVVEFTRGGDFGGGVAVIGRATDPDVDRAYMRYAKMGEGPDYLFFRPYHLLHYEAPRTIRQVVDQQRPLARPAGDVAGVVAVAKQPLTAGTMLDGIGGHTVYGHIAEAGEAADLLPVGLSEHARLVSDVPVDTPVALDAVELDDHAPLVGLHRRQTHLLTHGAPA